MLSKLRLGKVAIVAAMLCSSVTQAELVMDPYSSITIEWGDTTPTLGGIAKLKYDSDDDGNFEGSFLMGVSPYVLSMTMPNHRTDNWLWPIAGSGVSFSSVTLLSSYRDYFSTSIGLGFRIPPSEESKGGALLFPRYYSFLEAEVVDTAPLSNMGGITFEVLPDAVVSSVPEPGMLGLFIAGLLFVQIATRRTQQERT